MSTVDKFPNFLSGDLLETAANTFTTTRVSTPIPRIGTGRRGRSTVMELLYVDIDWFGSPLTTGGDLVQIEFLIGSAPTALVGWDDPRVFAFQRYSCDYVTSGGSASTFPKRYSFQEQNGFGYLLASDAFNVSIQGTSLDSASGIRWKLFYRFVDITTDEFVGIVQSQST